MLANETGCHLAHIAAISCCLWQDQDRARVCERTGAAYSDMATEADGHERAILRMMCGYSKK